ncbi:MAG: hypothetical protein ACE5E1_10510 [Phycisphaerae bacterium]
MRVQVDFGSGPKTFWYMLYTVTNHTGEDIDFNPEIVRVAEIESELPADQILSAPDRAPKLSVEPAIVGLHPKIFAAIQQRHAKTHPFLVKPVDAIRKLRQGKDNALSSVAVFKDLDLRASKFTIYFGGLSGERIRKPNPAYNPRLHAGDQQKKPDAASNPRFFILRKTLAIPYTLPGDLKTRRTATPKLGRMTWVMR